MTQLTLRRGDGEQLGNGRWVWGATVDEGIESGLAETVVLVPPAMMVLLRRQLGAPRNYGSDMEDLIEQAARRACSARPWRQQIELVNDDLTF